MRSLFIGRYQPFHVGHKELIETCLNDGKDVLIAVRDTPIDDRNPYPVQERIEWVRDAMEAWGNRVIVISIPDIAEVCHGRDVGWDVREIRLTEETEAISATNLRAVRWA